MEGKNHLVLFPFLAQGHITPFLHLAKRLDQHNNKNNQNISITLVSTPRNVAKLGSSLPKDSSIHLAELPFSSSNETTESIPLEQYTTFFESTETSLRAPFEKLIKSLIKQEGNYKKICIIADYFLGWTVEIAKKFEVSHAAFVTGGPYGNSVMFSIVLNPPPRSFLSEASPSSKFNLVDHPDVQVSFSTVANTLARGDGDDDHPINIFVRRQLVLSFQSSAILLNTIEELDEEGLRLFRSYPGLPVWPVGPLVSDANFGPLASDSKAKEYLEFLDSKTANSVIYISFGSNNSIPASQMVDLAKGLHASGKPFIWVIKPPVEFEEEVKEGEFKEEWLPEGFEESIKVNMQGLLVKHWAPQKEILSHVSTGAFLSHCGWNSVLESLYQGVPIIGWPLLADQLYNSSMLEEMGVCIEIARGRIFGGLEKGGWKKVKDAIDMVLGQEKGIGSEMRLKAGEIRDMLKMALRDDAELKGSSWKALDAFLQSTFHD
ncbi:hypothetical protein LUZ60_015016 [Juncus effusus]|nr:hypothetical protein LUZ60_015016 [Juncus effusus]